MPTPLPRRPRVPLRRLPGARQSNWKVTLVSLIGAILLVGTVFYFIGSSADENMRQRGVFDDEVVIPPGKEFGYVLVVSFSMHYRFEVKSMDGPAVMAVGRVDDGDSEQMSPKDLAGAMEHAAPVEAGKSRTESGEMSRGRYLWVVVNPSKDKSLRVRIKFG